MIGKEIAEHFLYLNNNLNPLKLQKLLWYFNILYYNNFKKFYFPEFSFMAWKYGPVVPPIWRKYSGRIKSLSNKEINDKKN